MRMSNRDRSLPRRTEAAAYTLPSGLTATASAPAELSEIRPPAPAPAPSNLPANVPAELGPKLGVLPPMYTDPSAAVAPADAPSDSGPPHVRSHSSAPAALNFS